MPEIWEVTKFPSGNLIRIGFILKWAWKQFKEKAVWFVAPESIIQGLFS